MTGLRIGHFLLAAAASLTLAGCATGDQSATSARTALDGPPPPAFALRSIGPDGKPILTGDGRTDDERDVTVEVVPFPPAVPGASPDASAQAYSGALFGALVANRNPAAAVAAGNTLGAAASLPGAPVTHPPPPSPLPGYLIRSEPKGAAVSVKSRAVGTGTDLLLTNLRAGDLPQLVLSLPGYEECRQGAPGFSVGDGEVAGRPVRVVTCALRPKP